MSIKANFPNLKPSLLLDFQNTKALDSRITFTRATTATYYDGKTVAKAEENLLTNSQTLNERAPFRSTWTANDTTAPDGTATAEALNQQAGQTTSGGVSLSSVDWSGVTTTFSCFAKANTKNFIAFYISTSVAAANLVYFDLDTGAVGTVGANITAASIVNAGNGWYRCIATMTGGNRRGIELADSDASRTVTDSGGVYLWGAQLEERSSVTAYTPTTTQPITNYIPVLQSAASGEARFDHDPVTGESKGLLIEEQRTNLFTYSEAFNNAAWSKTSMTVTADSVISPSGLLTADKLSPVSGSNTVFQSHTVTSGTTYTYSAYMKKAENNFGMFRAQWDGNTYDTVNFDLANGTTSRVPTGVNSVSIDAVGNGWYRCVVNFTPTDTRATNIQIKSSSEAQTSSSSTYSGTFNGFNGIFAWGAQLEEGAFPTSYIPTVASQVTRNADAASMTGTNFSSWYRADEGTVYVEASPAEISQTRYAFTISDGGTTNQIISSTGTGTNWLVAGAANINKSGFWVANTFTKLVGAYKVDDFAVTMNGAAVSTDTSGSISSITSLNQIQLGDRLAASRNLCGHIRKFAFYPARLSNTELEGLTS